MWLAETEGILSSAETELKFEFRTSDAVLGVIKSDIREVRLPFDRIEGITFRKEWLSGAIITIRVNEMRAASDLPGFKEGEVALSIARKHREVAAELVSCVQLALTAGKKTG
jgi:hypothetical protein